MKKLLSFWEDFDKFLYCVEEAECLVDIAFKLRVPVEDLIKDNALTEDVVAGQTLFIRREKTSSVLLPEVLAAKPENPAADKQNKATADKQSDRGGADRTLCYPFKIIKD